MGVPLLLTWLRRRFASCFLPSDSNVGADCLYIDVNGLVYQAAALATSGGADPGDVEVTIMHKLFELLDDIVLRLVRPRSLVYLAVDGISPMGKLAQQRSRRRRRRRPNTHARGHVTEWDSNSISVGTSFMSSLTDALHFYCVSRTERINGERLREYQRERMGKNDSDFDRTVRSEAMPPLITFVSDDVWRPGEGESKIADAIRRFRSQPNYDPNTAHVICSSDTDVTVCSLILHEPNIHVLRYEFVVGNATKGGNGDWHNCASDSWTSTFFSIYAFREELRARLRIEQGCGDNTTVEKVEMLNKRFEAALHDVVFVLLLFGNDFLPSVGCRIEEGLLDSLLEMLATDFVTRGRSIVDPTTNSIQFDAARYALESLAEMRNERVGGLRVDNGAEGATDWGFIDEQFLQQQAAEEAEKAPWCYAYWTMLQWSLQNSAGIVEHWGCYYPYSTAPPLNLLQKYCGTFSYDTLMELAAKKSCRNGNSLNHAGDTTDSELITQKVRARGPWPTDVLVQLLVLLPARSIALLPSAVRNGYPEVEPIVDAPVENIDFSALQDWCARKRELFTEEERTRFSTYVLAASDRLVAGRGTGECIRGNEMLFVADWGAEELAAELAECGQSRTNESGTSNSKHRGSARQLDCLGASSGSFATLFVAGGTRMASAAVAALRTATKGHTQVEGRNGDGTANNTTPSDCTASKAGEGAPGLSHDVMTLRSANFTLHAAATAALGNEAMMRRIGVITGDTFSCGLYSVGSLSRHQQTMRVRLRWRVASKPPRHAAPFLPYLLPGFEPSQAYEGCSRTAGRARTKRSLSEVGPMVNGDQSEKGANGNSSPQAALDGNLRKKRDALRRRLEALQRRDVTAEETGD